MRLFIDPPSGVCILYRFLYVDAITQLQFNVNCLCNVHENTAIAINILFSLNLTT